MTTTARLSRLRTASRSAALGAAVLALAVGCGSTSENDAATTEEQTSSSVDDSGEDTAADESSAGSASSDAGAAESSTGSDEAQAPTADADLADTALPVPAAEAAQLAREAAGADRLVSLSIDHDDDRGWVWEAELEADGTEHDLDIDATTGEVLEHDQEDDQAEDPVVDPTDPMTPEQAVEAALADRDGRVSGWELDSENGTVRYGVDIETGGDDVEVTVNVEDGSVTVED